tara:strand:- start:16982 stop:18163 length:1182 start_codon:yes stop_codon:yes gene_type:complete
LSTTRLDINLKTAIVRYHEIALKGHNRSWFINTLVENINRKLYGLKAKVSRDDSGIRIKYSDTVPNTEIIEKLSTIFGIAKFKLVETSEIEIDSLIKTVKKVLEENTLPFNTFKLNSNRSNKSYPLTSMELNERIGAYVEKLTGGKVDLSSPDLTITVDIREKTAYVSLKDYKGPGGLPVGVSAHVATLLSGGIDSPVAAFNMFKRGCSNSFIHFHSFPMVDASSREKAIKLAKSLSVNQKKSLLYLVPFVDIQMEIIAKVQASYRVIAYRRFMVRVAEAIAKIDGASALVTGESVGQVASQTIENIATIGSVTNMPIFRPLIATNKSEIIDQAKLIGTYDVSIQPDEDCCSLFVPANPATKSTPRKAELYETGIDSKDLVNKTIDNLEILEF